MKVRKKPCRHCLFTINAVVDRNDLDHQRSVALSSHGAFKCHEHSCNTVTCNGAYKHNPDMTDKPEFISYNGDLKHKFSNMTKEDRDKYRVRGS